VGIALLAAAAVTTSGCAQTHTRLAGSPRRPAQPPSAPRPLETLRVWSYDAADPTIAPVLRTLAARFAANHPHVRVVIENRPVSTLADPQRLNTPDPPDIVEGVQSSAVDGAAVRAGLIIPLDAFTAQLGFDAWLGAGALRDFRFGRDGASFGRGPVWGVAQTGQLITIYYDAAVLRRAGVAPAELPTTLDAFSQLLATLRTKLPVGEPVLELGDRDGYGASHLLAAIEAVTGPPQAARDWVLHSPGVAAPNDATRVAFATVAAWAANGYLNNDYATIGYDQAADVFAHGRGAFLVEGSWEAPVVDLGLGPDAGAMLLAPRVGAPPAASGAPSGSWHVTTASKHPALAAAFLAYMIGSADAAALLVSAQQIPVAPVPGPLATGLTASLIKQWRAVTGADTLVPYSDWASPTMFTTLATQLRGVLAGTVNAPDAASAVAADWAAYDHTVRRGRRAR
jgi:raffinose/stachyose/melibiose transport system substrate-binding protein